MVARSEADRWAVITHTNSGKSIAQIVRLTGFTWDFVSRWAGRAKANQGGHDKPRAGGRPKSITTPMVAKIKKTIKKDQQSIRSVARTVGVSRESVRRISRANLYPYHQPARPMLTEEHKRRRRKFARDYAGFDWRRTVSFTDEKWFSLSPRAWQQQKRRRMARERASLVPPKRRVAFAPRFMVWGAITYNGVGPIVRIEGNINALSYQATLAGRRTSWYTSAPWQGRLVSFARRCKTARGGEVNPDVASRERAIVYPEGGLAAELVRRQLLGEHVVHTRHQRSPPAAPQ